MPFPKEEDRCLYTYADGRRCRMPRLEQHPSLCFHHWNRDEALSDSVKFARELLGPSDHLDTARSVNRALAHVFRFFAEGRLSARHASTLAYIGQLLLLTLPHLDRERARDAQQAASPASFQAQVQGILDSICKVAPLTARDAPPDQPCGAPSGDSTSSAGEDPA